MNDLKDFINSISSNIKDRFSNPLVSSFLISWLIINYKFVMTLFGEINEGGNWIDKINYINLVLWSGWDFYFYVFVYPLISTFLWVFIITYGLRRFIVYERGRVNYLKARVLRVDRTKVLTKAEEINLRMHVTREWIKIANQKEESSRALQDEIEKSMNLEKQKTSLEQMVDNAKKIIEENQEEIKKEKSILADKNIKILELQKVIRPDDIYIDLKNIKNDYEIVNLLRIIGFDEVSNLSSLNELVENDIYKISFPVVVKTNVVSKPESRLILARNDIFSDYSFILVEAISQHLKNNSGIIFFDEVKDICDKYDLNLIGSINELIKLNILTIKNLKNFIDNELHAEIEQKVNDVYHLFSIFGFKTKKDFF